MNRVYNERADRVCQGPRMRTSRLLAAVAAGGAVAVVAVRRGRAEREGRSVDRDWPVDFAHRGASARAPENTLEAFRLAEGDGLHLRLVLEPALREAAGAHQGAVGLMSLQHSSSGLTVAANASRRSGSALGAPSSARSPPRGHRTNDACRAR